MKVTTKNLIRILVISGVVLLYAYYSGKGSHNLLQEENVPATQQSATTSVTSSTPTIKTDLPSQVSSSAKKVISSASVPASYSHSYTNNEYGFTLRFPSYVTQKSTFSTFHQIGNNWRLYPSPSNQGKPLVSFTVFSLDQGVYVTGKQKYPLYFLSEVRVGTSLNTQECYSKDALFPNQKVTTVTLGGATFKKFSTRQDTGPAYVQAESYRTIRKNMCLVIEVIKNGTTYRDDKMLPGLSDQLLESYYTTGDSIVKTITFFK